jgi:hypothetical protein
MKMTASSKADDPCVTESRPLHHTQRTNAERSLNDCVGPEADLGWRAHSRPERNGPYQAQSVEAAKAQQQIVARRVGSRAVVATFRTCVALRLRRRRHRRLHCGYVGVEDGGRCPRRCGRSSRQNGRLAVLRVHRCRDGGADRHTSRQRLGGNNRRRHRFEQRLSARHVWCRGGLPGQHLLLRGRHLGRVGLLCLGRDRQADAMPRRGQRLPGGACAASLLAVRLDQRELDVVGLPLMRSVNSFIAPLVAKPHEPFIRPQ